nr:uncharacterized protein LOC123003532 [Drosophila takahashii]
MPTSHSPRRSPRIGQTGATAAATTTTATTSAGTPKNAPGLSGGELQRPRTPKQPGLIPSGAPKLDRSGQDTDTTTAKFAALMERIASLERELQKARSGEGQDAAARDPVRNGSSGIGASGAANAPPCLSATPGQNLSGNLPPLLSGNLAPNLAESVTPFLHEQLPPLLSGNLPPQSSGNLAIGQQVTLSTNSTTLSYSTPCCVTATVQPALSYMQAPREPLRNLMVPPQSTGSYGIASPSPLIGWTPRRLPDLPEFEGQPEEWPIFQCAFTETTAAYNCTALENNQRLLKALKGEARASVKSLLIHPNNVQAVMDQLRFRYGRPEQLIRSQLESVREVQPIQEHNIIKIVPFATRVSNLAAFLQSSPNGEQHLGNPTLMEELIAKLPLSKRLDWARHAALIGCYPTVAHLSEWLNELAKLVCTITSGDSKDPKRRVLHASTSQKDQDLFEDHPRSCPICEGQHTIKDCKDFNQATPTARMEYVRKHRICFSCLESGHMSRFCKKNGKCNVYGCQMRHHYLLHDGVGNPTRPSQLHGRPWPNERSDRGRMVHAGADRRKVDTQVHQPDDLAQRSPLTASAQTQDAWRKRDEGRQPSDGNGLPHRNLSCVDPDGGHLLFRILPVTLYGEDTQLDTYALFDEGSSVTLIDEELTRSLNLKGESRQLNIQWFGGKSAKENTKMVSLQISGVGRPKRHALKNVYAVSNLNLPMQSLRREDVKAAKAPARLPMKPYRNAVPRILIGLDHAHLGIPMQNRSFGAGGPYAAATKLGWVVFGPVRSQMSSPMQRSCLLAVPQYDHLEKMVSDYFEIENFGVKPAPPVAASGDARALGILNETTRRVGERYQTGLLWKDDKVSLPDSYNMALKRLVGIERKMRRDDSFARAYKSIMEDYVNKGYARRLDQQEVAADNRDKIWYLPHFGVENPNKPGKIRLVFDAAAKVGNTSLNSVLLKGPQQFKSLPAVLFHFREGAVGVCADIKEMFHQVLIQPQDRCAQRFLWRNGDDRRDPDLYEMVVMTFGAACSPCSAHHVKTINASRYAQADPRAVQAINEYHYVDDYVDSFSDEKEAIAVSERVRKIHAEAGFELCRFSSSSESVVKALNPLGSNKNVEWNEAEEKILGMYWHPATDEFKFSVKYHRVPSSVMTGERAPTKREFLSLVMSTFDPIGFLSCFMVTAKLLMREIWRRGVQWDEPLPDELAKAFESWRLEMDYVRDFRCPRYYFGTGCVRELQLHVFVDSSQSAFAAVAFWRATYDNDDVRSYFVCSKTKCAPMKTMTIPRLELQAAVLGTRLMDTVRREHDVSISRCVLWTDSKTVLHWISSTHRRYKQFVGNRVAEILESTEVSQWRWIPSAENVADDATRPQRHVDLSQGARWMSGPSFLRESEEQWPKPSPSERDSPHSAEEEMPCEFTLVIANEFISLQRFSNYNRLVRTTAWILRFIRRCRGLSDESEAYGITATECAEAERKLIQRAQADTFADEVQGKAVAKGSQLRGLSPYVDHDGIIRACGRIDAAECVPFNARRPIILSHKHALAEMIVRHYHRKMKHQNLDATISEIRTRFWITNLRRVLRSVVATCNVCKLRRVRPIPPLMGPLPEDRLEPNGWPFKYTGLDYFGPLFVTIGRRTEKRWVALFTCLTTRAVHLEIAHDLSTDSCIIAMRNFMCRRGPVVRLRSDNGKNFIGADREARKFDEVFEPEKIQDELSSKGIEWIFNCPANPAAGGIWERMVQFTVDQEAPLTPNDLLRGVANVPDLPGDRGEQPVKCATRKQWRIARMMRDRFWKRWVHEYLPTLVRREKWCEHVEPMRPGNLVYICDPAIPRREWRKGVVEEVYPGADGVPRRAAVRTTNGDRAKLIMRPISRLAILDVVNAVASPGWGCRGTD